MTNWASEFETYEEACRYYGADTPDDLVTEAFFRDREEGDRMMDSMEAGVIQPNAVFCDIEWPF